MTQARKRSRKSARAAGSRFNREIATYLRDQLKDEAIIKSPSWGAKDKGDVWNVRFHGQRVVIETKDVARVCLPQWTEEANMEAHNAEALAGLVIHKRHGVSDPGKQWVSCTVDDLVALFTGEPSKRVRERAKDDRADHRDEGD
ncbi:RusA-like resolvase [Mycobacterium phage Kumao]|uniref:RusA-like resolvase n=1 Tax=Mycobacterium phage Kumao TaxID=2041344 RepID=A0A2D1GPU9_9CAUD|nr:RusA-like resolvase [Mycobacterium phage Kumao]ATN94030.1 RusA-like resolvase [Mycobacterium phage Kumao]